MLAAFTLASGALALLGWFIGPKAFALNSWAGGIVMQPNTAACLAMLGLSMLLIDRVRMSTARILGMSLAGLAALVGAATFIQHVAGVNFGIDTLIVEPTWGQTATVAPGRMGPPAALCFFLSGVAVVMRGRGRALGVARTLALVVLSISLLSVCGYIYGAPVLYSLPQLTGIAFNTGLTLLILSIAVVASIPDREPMRTLLSDSGAGMMARRALPVIIVLPLVLGLLRVELGEQDEIFASTIRTVFEIIGLGLLLWWALRAVRGYEQRIATHAAELTNALDKRTRELTESYEQLRRSETMAVLGALSAGFGHDLANIVFPMRVRLQMLQKADLAPQHREHVDAILGNVEYINSLGTRVRQYMRDARQSITESDAARRRAVNFANWCREVHPFLQSIVAVSRSVELRCDVPENLSHHDLDKTGLTQAVYNLVQNSIKAMRQSRTGQTITITGSRNEQGDVLLAVEDDGPGLTPEALATCMEFSVAARADGGGLGLPLVKAFVDAQGGEIRVYSPPVGKPRGTVVIMRFPDKPSSTQVSGRPTTAHNHTKTTGTSDDAQEPVIASTS